jgi:uncharacterized protein YbjT (DUF2867 family)
MSHPSGLICLTGGTGYVGGRLLGLLEERGERVRCLSRRTVALQNRVGPKTEVVHADVLDRDSLIAALDGAETAYYLVHNMGSDDDFEQKDRQGATNFAEAAKACSVKRIIYLGGLGEPSQRLSAHLRSRQEVGKILCQSGAQVIEFRASIIIGSGSLSFEIIRTLVERLPIMVCPKWVSIPAQPIAIEDVLDYLLSALDLAEGESRVFEIGGPDQVSYGNIMREYARQRGLKRLMIPIPVLTPYLSSLWLGLVTPVYARVGRKLIEGVRNPTVVRDNSALKIFNIRPRPLNEAIERALVNEDEQFAKTHWTDAFSSGGEPVHWGGQRFGSRIIDSRSVDLNVPVEAAFEPIRRIGGKTGWYFGNFLWRMRGRLDLMVSGVGVRRGRRNPAHLHPGDVVDFWRVEAFEPPYRLRLHSEMKLPGRAWLELEVFERKGGARIRQTATFDPVGLTGLAYWYALYPLHHLVFNGMLRGIARAAESHANKKTDD